MIGLIRKICIYIICAAYSVLAYIKDVWDIHLRRKHNKILSQSTGTATPPTSPSHIAIVTLFPSDEGAIFARNLLLALLANQFYVLVVSNCPLKPHHAQSILPHCHTFIVRPNVGRDIGAYQHGILWLTKQGLLQKADLLILANDSLYYPQNIKSIIADMVQRPDPWQCLFENFEHHYHAQSFFLLFRKEIFLSEPFKMFWRRYFPSSTRVHSIQKGEVGLTKAFKKIGYLPTAYYTALHITNTIRKAAKDETIEKMPVCEMLFDLYCPSAQDGFLSNQNLASYPRKAIYLLERILNQKNPTHLGGLAVSHVLHAPLKRDLFYRRIFDLCQILKYAGGFTTEEILLLEKDLRRRCPPETGISIFKKALFAKGYL